VSDVPSDRLKTDETAAPPRRPVRRFLVLLIFLVSFLAACSLLAIEATEPFSRSEACTNCHEMQPVYDRWTKSSHYHNPSGVKTSCIACHLPPREDHFAHLLSKAKNGASHGWTHFFGRGYDPKTALKTVLDSFPNERCTYCHNNLLAQSSKPAVGAVHAIALKRTDTRTYACVVCHHHIHSKEPPPPEKKYYDEADNSFCYDCHTNFKKEPFVLQHQAANIACYDCHGDSLPHADDEENATPPDIMFTKDMVNDSCGKSGCHSKSDLQKTISHKAWYAGADPDKKYCTDCHNQHRLDTRQRKWDKKTRRLISRDGQDLDPDESPETKPADEMGM